MTNGVNEAQATYATASPRTVIEASVRRLLRGHMQELYEGLWTIMANEAGASGLKIEEARLSRLEDPEENTWELVIEVTVSAGARQAMAYWDAIGRSVDSWVKRLPPNLKELFFSRWSFVVNWTDHGSH